MGFLPPKKPRPLFSLPLNKIHIPPAMSSATFVFSASLVNQCLADISVPDISPFDALASLLWLRISSYKDGGLGAAQLTLALDCRRRMYAPLPIGFYGNALHFLRVKADLSFGWDHVASELRRHAADIKEDDIWSSVEWLHERRKEKAFQMYGPELTCLAMDDVLLYGPEFGTGILPVNATCRIGNAQGEGLVLVMAGPPGEGDKSRTVVVTLPTDLTAKICQDDVILKYGPKIMFSSTI
jgi:Transferase family